MLIRKILTICPDDAQIYRRPQTYFTTNNNYMQLSSRNKVIGINKNKHFSDDPTQSNQRKNSNIRTKTNSLPRTEKNSQTTTIEEKFLRKIIQEIPNSNKITKEIPKEKPNKEQDKTIIKNKPKEREKTLTKTEDIKRRSSSKQRPIFKTENKYGTLEYMETGEELDTESATNSNKKNSLKITPPPKKKNNNKKQ